MSRAKHAYYFLFQSMVISSVYSRVYENIYLAKLDAKAAATIQEIAEDNMCKMKHVYYFIFRSIVISSTIFNSSE
jgi:hypothetical protein